MYYALTDSFIVSADSAKTWEFFSSAENLPAITPPWLAFNVLTPKPIHLRKDSTIDYTIRWMGLPVRWKTLIIDWTPPVQFVDLQIRGPYVLWHHQHTFEPHAEGTLCRDRVLYKIPFGPFGSLGHALLVRRQLIEIFSYRRQQITAQLGMVRALQPAPAVEKIG